MQKRPFVLWRLRDMAIRRKLMAITLLVALLISAVSLGGFQLVAHNSNRMIYTQTAASLGVIADKVAARLGNIMEVSLYLAVNREFQSNLQIINEQQGSAAQGVARSQLSSQFYRTFHSDIIAMSLFPLGDKPIVLGVDSSSESAAVQARAQSDAALALGAPVWLSTGRSDGSVLCVRQIRNVSRPFLEPMGLLVMRVNLSKIVRESAGDILSGQYSIAISQGEEMLFPHMQNGSSPFGEAVFTDQAPYAIRRQEDGMFFVTHSTIQGFRLSWDLVLGIPYGEVFRSLVLANVLFAAGLVCAVVLVMLLSRRMLGSINRNVESLVAKMERVRSGDLSPYSTPMPPGEDELGRLNRHFDKMTADFKKVIDDNYVKELLLTQTQLKALEQQINPHFLYNSLEAINWFARRGEGENVSSIAQALGRLLRSNLSEDEDCIRMERELGILESYLSIQRIRFPDTLRVHVSVQEEAMDALVPKMSIQPLVENAIIHSLEENIGQCHIDVSVTRQGDMVRVEVENDGSEIDVDILQKLRKKSQQPKGHGIGLINIDSRIKLLFGQEYGLHLQTRPNRVTVSFDIPARFPAKPEPPDAPPQETP